MSKDRRKYYVKPEDRIIVGTEQLTQEDMLDNGIFRCMPKEYQREMIDNFIWSTDIWKYMKKLMQTPIKAVARCSDNDVFNEKVGVKLVEQKLVAKKHDRIARLAERLENDLREMSIQMSVEAIKRRDKITAIKKDINEYFGGEIIK